MAAITRAGPRAPVPSRTYITKATGLKVAAVQRKRTATGTRLTAAQRRALTIGRIAGSYRRSRLQAAQTTIRKYNALRGRANAASVAAFAVKQSALQSQRGAQNRNLQHQVFTDYGRHVTLLGRLQFAQAGERRYVTQAVLNTVTQRQATSYATYLYNLAQRGLRLATATTAPGPARRKSGYALPSKGYAVPSGITRPVTARTPRQRQAPCGAPVTAGPRSAGWLGRPQDPDCVPVAVANAMLAHTGYRAGRLLLRRLEREAGPAPTIPRCVEALSVLLRDGGHPVRIAGCRRVPAAIGRVPGHVIGYQSRYGPHAALSLPGGRVASWGREVPRDGAVEEAWDITWTAA